jgi:hypothetical protein
LCAAAILLTVLLRWFSHDHDRDPFTLEGNVIPYAPAAAVSATMAFAAFLLARTAVEPRQHHHALTRSRLPPLAVP